ncbi:cysteine hydrolase family protein [Blastococcus capsensis]|uniref:cysteine hydrolase family protein n=1 Tax=Blastococcus capsensis TaxID=1564163 RepID=UPI0025422F54|nr:cysteine hydrolase [Blastococcus capsensis]MDK3255439.1 cysteine hydrolase [Blastococcus capsensis]
MTALIVVDVQNDFCDPAGVCGVAGSDTSGVVDMVPRLERLLKSARAAGVFVVFVQTTHDETTDSVVWLSRRAVDTALAGTPTSTCRPGSWGAEFYKVTPAPDEPVVIKHRYSAFTDTNLDAVLRGGGITSLLFAGVSTDVCVESSLRDGLFHDYHVTLVEDCCASYHPEGHAATIRTVSRYFGAVTTSGELAQAWTSVSGSV